MVEACLSDAEIDGLGDQEEVLGSSRETSLSIRSTSKKALGICSHVFVFVSGLAGLPGVCLNGSG